MFEPAKTLVRRAQERVEWIGDDHGDPFEEALIAGVVSDEMHVALKEILDHLRSALDYAAREICAACGPLPPGRPIYFPIAGHGFAAGDFKSRVGKLMPGLLQQRLDLLPVLASFQEFSSPDNGWLPDLATLANYTKHERLEINKLADARAKYWKVDGQQVLSITYPNGSPFRRRSFSMHPDYPPDGFGEGHVPYLRLALIDRELLTFFDEAVPGVGAILERLEAVV